MDSKSDKFELMKSDERAAMLKDETSAWLNVAKFEQFQRVASMLSKTDFIPDRFRNNVGNCMIALDMGQLMGMHPIMLMRTMYIVHGQPGFEGKFVSALINNSKRYNDPLEYEWKGEKGKSTWGCRAFAIRKSTGKKVCGPWVDWQMVEAEGWNKPKGSPPRQQKSKWTTMPELMFMYRAATFFGRVNDSDLLMGMQTIEEIEDTKTDMIQRSDGTLYDVNAKAPPKEPTNDDPGPDETPAPDKHMDKPEKSMSGHPSEEPTLDHFGTSLDSPFEKTKWFHMRAGTPSSGTGFAVYVHTNRNAIEYVSNATYDAMCQKFEKFYDKPFPYLKNGNIRPWTDDDSENFLIGDNEQDENDADLFEQNSVRIEEQKNGRTEESQNDTESVLNSEAAKTLAVMANDHKREYIMVVKNRVPESVEQIYAWISRINELVIEHKRNPPTDESDKF